MEISDMIKKPRISYITIMILLAFGVISCSSSNKTVEDFNCWTGRAPNRSLNDLDNSGRLVLSYRIDNELRLYRFEFSDRQYFPLISGISDYGIGRASPVSPNGQSLWYGIYNDPTRDLVFAYNLSDQGTQPIPYLSTSLYVSSSPISWSADNQCLMFWLNKTAVAYSLAMNTLQQKTFSNANFTEYGAEVSVSADGQWWAWPCQMQLCIMDVASGQQVDDESLGVPLSRSIGVVRWSTNNNNLAFAYSHNKTYRFLDTVRLVYFDNGAVTTFRDISISGVQDLSWSPNGQQLMISIADGSQLQIYDLATTNVKTITQVLRYYGTPAWSPSGSQAALISDDHRHIYVVTLDSGKVVEIPPISSDMISNTLNYNVWNVFWTP
jgi:WD40 repeat protein